MMTAYDATRWVHFAEDGLTVLGHYANRQDYPGRWREVASTDPLVTAYDSPPPPLPDLTRRQTFFLLDMLVIDPQTVDGYIARLEDPEERRWATIEWREAASFRRDHPLVLAFEETVKDLLPAQKDDLWRYAATL